MESDLCLNFPLLKLVQALDFKRHNQGVCSEEDQKKALLKVRQYPLFKPVLYLWCLQVFNWKDLFMLPLCTQAYLADNLALSWLIVDILSYFGEFYILFTDQEGTRFTICCYPLTIVLNIADLIEKTDPLMLPLCTHTGLLGWCNLALSWGWVGGLQNVHSPKA